MQMRLRNLTAAYSVLASVCALTCAPSYADPVVESPGIAVVHDAAASRIQVGGMLKVTVVVQTAKTIPDGTTMLFSASANVVDASYTNSHTVAGSAKIIGGKAQLTLDIPYIWVVAAKTDKMSVSCNVSANVTGNQQTSYSTSVSSSMALPPNGATTAVTLNGSI